MDGLEVRAAAAVDLARAGLLDGEIALSYVLWPTPAVEAASEAVAASGGLRREHSERMKARALELGDAGWSWERAAREVGVAKSTVQMWIAKRPPAADQDSGVEAWSARAPEPD